MLINKIKVNVPTKKKYIKAINRQSKVNFAKLSVNVHQCKCVDPSAKQAIFSAI